MTATGEQLELATPTAQRCGSRFTWNGRPLRCNQKARHGGDWHSASPGGGAEVRWNDAGSYETSQPTRHR